MNLKQAIITSSNPYESIYRSLGISACSDSTYNDAQQISRHLGMLHNTLGIVIKDLVQILKHSFPSRQRKKYRKEKQSDSQKSQQNYFMKISAQKQLLEGINGIQNKNLQNQKIVPYIEAVQSEKCEQQQKFEQLNRQVADKMGIKSLFESRIGNDYNVPLQIDAKIQTQQNKRQQKQYQKPKSIDLPPQQKELQKQIQKKYGLDFSIYKFGPQQTLKNKQVQIVQRKSISHNMVIIDSDQSL